MGDDPVLAARAKKAEEWYERHQQELAERAAVKELARAQRREANRAAWATRADADAADREATHAARQAVRAEHASDWTARGDELRDPFTISQAARLGVTPAEYLRIREERRAKARTTLPLAEQLTLAPLVGERASAREERDR